MFNWTNDKSKPNELEVSVWVSSGIKNLNFEIFLVFLSFILLVG